MSIKSNFPAIFSADFKSMTQAERVSFLKDNTFEIESIVVSTKPSKDGRAFSTATFIEPVLEGMEGTAYNRIKFKRNFFGAKLDKDGKIMKKADSLYNDACFVEGKRILIAPVSFKTTGYPILDVNTGKTNIAYSITVYCLHNEDPLAYANSQLKNKAKNCHVLATADGVEMPKPAYLDAVPSSTVSLTEKDVTVPEGAPSDETK